MDVAGSASGTGTIPKTFRNEFLKTCTPEPETPLGDVIGDEQLSRVFQFLDDAGQIEEQRAEWQRKVGTDVKKLVAESVGLKRTLASMEQKLGSMEAKLMQPALMAEINRGVLGRAGVGLHHQRSSRELGGEDSSMPEIKAMMSEAILRIETSLERHMMAIGERGVQQLDSIVQACNDLKETGELMVSHYDTRMQNTRMQIPKTDIPGSTAEDGDNIRRAPPTTMSLTPGTDTMALRPMTPHGLAEGVGAVLDRTSKARNFLRVGGQAASAKEVTQCVLIMQMVSFWLTFLYLVFVGVSLSVSLSRAHGGHELPGWIQLVNWVFLAIFSVELAVRLSLQKSAFFLGKSRKWNIIDSILTIIQVFEVLGLSVPRLSLARAVKLVILLKTTRSIRQSRALQSFRLIWSRSLWRPVMWGALSALFLTYLFSLLFAKLVTDWLLVERHETADPAHLVDLEDHYGTLYKTMVSLFMAFTGGQLWADLLRPLKRISFWCEPLFITYIVLTTGGLANILVAIFVEMARFTSQRDHDTQMTQREEKDRELIDGLKLVLQDADSRGTGRVSRDAVVKVLSEKENKKALKELGLELEKVCSIFTQLDAERIGIEELCHCLLNMSADSHFSQNSMLMFQSKRTLDKIDFIGQIIGNQLSKLEKLIVDSRKARVNVIRE